MRKQNAIIFSTALLVVGPILVLAGLFYFNIYSNFTYFSDEEGWEFFNCKTISPSGETYYAIDPDYCIVDFLTRPYLLGITVPSFALVAIGAVAIYFGLRIGKQKRTSESKNK